MAHALNQQTDLRTLRAMVRHALPGMSIRETPLPAPVKPLLQRCRTCGRVISDKRRFCFAHQQEAFLTIYQSRADEETARAIVLSTTKDERQEMLTAIEKRLLQEKNHDPAV